jgi:UV DNA damage endonuclease
LDPDQTQTPRILEEIQRPYTEKNTTVAWLSRQTKTDAEQRLWDIMEHNGKAALKLVEYVGSLEPELRMVRLGSNQLPCYTQDDFSYYWQKPDVRERASQLYSKVGDAARKLDVRISFHPGQFVVLASDNPDIVERSIDEFEYHVDLLRWIGYGKRFQDAKCNIHISGRGGPQGIRKIFGRLSPEARNTITVENEEISWGLEDCLELADIVPTVLDIHHHWVKTGEYIDHNDDRVKMVLESWRGVRPTMHYSVTKEDYLPDHPTDVRPNLESLLQQGYKKQKLRAHSDYYWNSAVNEWAIQFWPDFDIMCESKAKNLASIKFYKDWSK